MSYQLKDCVWNDAEHTSFNCVWTHPELGNIPFTARGDDPAGQDLFAFAVDHATIAEPDPGQLLAEAKAAALAAISRAANAAKSADIEYQGVTYQADTRSEQALTNWIALLQASGSTKAMTTWIAADNTTHDLSFADLSGLASAIGERNQKIVLQARAKKDAIEQAETPEAVAKIKVHEHLNRRRTR